MHPLLSRTIKSTGLRKEHVAAARMYAERHVLATTRPSSARTGGRILCYHSVGQPALGVNDVTPARFRRQIEIALEAGFRFAPAAEIARTGGGLKDLAITFDDGLKSLLAGAEPILAEHGIPWSVFVVSDWTENGHPWGPDVVMDWKDLRGLRERGVDIGSHSATHADFGKIDAAEMERELVGSRRLIADRLGFEPETFAIPLGQSGNWNWTAMQLATAAGYDVVYAQAEATRAVGTVPRTFVTSLDNDRIFRALLGGAYDRWEEWVWA